MRHLIALFITALVPLVAAAQTPAPAPDIVLVDTAGVYPIGCVAAHDDDLTTDLCFARTDLPAAIELGCIGAESGEEVHTTVIVPKTAGTNATIRCYAENRYDLLNVLRSPYSLNKGTINFSTPGAPRLVAKLRGMRGPKRLYAKCTPRRVEFKG